MKRSAKRQARRWVIQELTRGLSRFQRGGQRMLSVIPSHSLVRDADHGGQIPCCRERRAAA